MTLKITYNNDNEEQTFYHVNRVNILSGHIAFWIDCYNEYYNIALDDIKSVNID